ncbi:hypothetical protein C0J52_06137, partial [Blattella germanica]
FKFLLFKARKYGQGIVAPRAQDANDATKGGAKVMDRGLCTSKYLHRNTFLAVESCEQSKINFAYSPFIVHIDSKRARFFHLGSDFHHAAAKKRSEIKLHRIVLHNRQLLRCFRDWDNAPLLQARLLLPNPITAKLEASLQLQMLIAGKPQSGGTGLFIVNDVRSTPRFKVGIFRRQLMEQKGMKACTYALEEFYPPDQELFANVYFVNSTSKSFARLPLRAEDVAKSIALIDDGRSLRYAAATVRTPYSTLNIEKLFFKVNDLNSDSDDTSSYQQESKILPYSKEQDHVFQVFVFILKIEKLTCLSSQLIDHEFYTTNKAGPESAKNRNR